MMAAARSQTMEAAIAEAVDLWTAHRPVAATDGKVRQEAERMRAQVDRIAASGNGRLIQSAMCVLDCMALGL